jgi:predicted DNA-binding protein (MmcQ/YjbR family)
MFALSALGRQPLSVNLKCEPGLAEELRDAYPAVRPGWHMNKRHWNTVDLDGTIPDATVRQMIEDSYDLVVAALPKAKRLRLGWDGEG